MKRFVSFSLALIMIMACMTSCATQKVVEEPEWPQESISILIGFTAGGSGDVVSRMLGKGMQEYLGTEVVCTNVEGSSGAIAGQQVYDAPADGYTMYGGNAHNAAGWRMLDYADVGWDDYYGFHVVTAPYILFVKYGSKYNTAQELIDDMKANPGQIKWGNAGLGSINHMTGEMFIELVGATATSIPYNGGREAAVKVMADEVVFSWAGVSDVMDLAVSGEIKVLGVASEEPLVVKSDKGEYTAPSLIDTWPELTAVENLLFWGLRVKRETPAPVVKKIQEAINYAIQQPDFIELCESRYLTIAPMTGQEDDELCAFLESMYSWGLMDQGLAGKGLSPEQFGIPKPEDFTYPPHDRAKNANPWPA